MSGFYVNELLLRLLPRHESAPGALRSTTSAVIARLSDPSQDPAAGLRLFEKRLLEELGWGSSSCTDAATGEPIEPRRPTVRIDGGAEAIDGVAEGALVFDGASLLAARARAARTTPACSRTPAGCCARHSTSAWKVARCARARSCAPCGCTAGPRTEAEPCSSPPASRRQHRPRGHAAPGAPRHLPDPLLAALVAEQSGADSITLHLREDRRHIQDHDVERMRAALQTRMNLEMAATEAMVAIARRVRPQDVCLVPESARNSPRRAASTWRGRWRGCARPVPRSGRRAAACRCSSIPSRRSSRPRSRPARPWSNCTPGPTPRPLGERQAVELARLVEAARHGSRIGLTVHAGHGLHYHNVQPVAAIPEIVELNIGHAIVARAVLEGMAGAVRAMKDLMQAARIGIATGP